MAGNLVKRIRDYALSIDWPECQECERAGCSACGYANTVTETHVNGAFRSMGIDDFGLTTEERAYLATLVRRFTGGPVGVENLAMACGWEMAEVRKTIEPYLIRTGLIMKAKAGRTASADGFEHVKDCEREGWL